MQAVDEGVSKKITVTPNELSPGKNVEFQPTSPTGVSFPADQKTPTITVKFDKPAEVQSVTLPRDKPSGGNVEQFNVTFYSPDGKKINDEPISSSVSPKDDKTKPATIDSSKIPPSGDISRIDITVVKTTDGESPKGVVLDIKACVESIIGKFQKN